MDLITQFISRYRKEYDFYEQACRMVSQVLDANLQSAGIRAIVTSRAKNPQRLETKVRQREKTRAYNTVEEIFDDIVDLAGVRVALYFPAEREEVGRTIRTLFALVDEPKNFPAEVRKTTYTKRFSGYWATHYRVGLPETLLNDSQKRYAEARVEIQVASVLMHAWSEVEHDLVYKPLQGELSEDEYAILDELNGLVLAGEIALERLQRAGDARVSSQDREYGNHYDLAASLLEMSRSKLANQDIHEAAIGRVDLLFQLLAAVDMNKPEDLVRYIDAIHADFERRPLAEQVIDQVLSEDPRRYTEYERIRAGDASSAVMSLTAPSLQYHSEAIGEFITHWIGFERMVRDFLSKQGYNNIAMPTGRMLSRIEGLSPNLVHAAERLRQFRNQLVHGIDFPDVESIRANTQDLKMLVAATEEGLRPPPKKPRKKTK